MRVQLFHFEKHSVHGLHRKTIREKEREGNTREREFKYECVGN